ncbi:hypothetical protein FJT64_012308 [Amphibalanus amphitrite]|uniref:Uncharacterized protein n=1 Tax=Amphibalanus amphitrite TaxID=1232801 RepID=A0A6A4V718_AMPAM|nr:hypothetical protein FJT64_012308 [Amphibalanus amphitrite]
METRLIDSYVERIEQWSRLQSGDVEGLDRYALFVTDVKNAMSGATMGEFEHPSTLRLIASKLPVYLQDRWLREADRLSESGSFLTESLARRLKVRRDDTSISIETVGNERRVMQTSLASGLEVCGLDEAEFLPLPPLLTIDRIPVTQSDRCRMVSGEKERPEAARTR